MRSEINKYIDLLDTLESDGISKKQTIVCLPEGSAHPLFAILDEGTRDKAIRHIETTPSHARTQGTTSSGVHVTCTHSPGREAR